VASLLKKYRLLDLDGGSINELNAELRSKYTVDLTASVAEIQKVAQKRQPGTIFQPPWSYHAAEGGFASRMPAHLTPAFDLSVASVDQYTEYDLQSQYHAAGYTEVTPDPRNLQNVRSGRTASSAGEDIPRHISSAQRPSHHPSETGMLTDLRSTCPLCVCQSVRPCVRSCVRACVTLAQHLLVFLMCVG
jgi:hypothetical protein